MTVWRIPEGAGVPVHIGRPLLGERCHVVDAHGRRLPAGVPGHLMVSVAGVGQGYWQQPTLTADRFCPLPDAGEQLAYETGDMAVFEADHGSASSAEATPRSRSEASALSWRPGEHMHFSDNWPKLWSTIDELILRAR
ncbi:hypothetical protein ACH4VR_14795 [Streptomyces sp. NPDC020883]|uniref:hypothetical protein n=1 Tax=Streptomyces sp. NPDC020883 TaxID=3365099 RepID=UPI0037AAEC4B